MTITTVRLPSSARATRRGRSPGSITVHPSRRPAAPATNTLVSSSIPCGRIRPQNFGCWPTAANSPSATPRWAPLPISTYSVPTQSRMPSANARNATRTLLENTDAANSLAGAEE